MSALSVSIVMPVFDRAELVTEALASVQAQTELTAEIIVVDDGSTDATDLVVEEIARADPRVRLLRTVHAGPAAARNLGIAAAQGEYLTFVDSDDLCPPGRIRRQIAKLAARPDVTAVVGAIVFFDALDLTGAPLRDPRHLPHHTPTLQSSTFRTDEFRGFGPLDETLSFAEDVDFFIRLLEVDVRLLLESEVACFYRDHPGQMTRDSQAKQQGYVRAYARSLARRRASGRTRPLTKFWPVRCEHDTEFGGGHVLQRLRHDVEPAGLRPFVNAFYLSYWRKLTALTTLSLTLQVSGPGSVQLRHRRTGGGRAIVHELPLAAGRRSLSLEIALKGPTQDGVIEVVAEDGAVIHSGAWVTFDEPRQDVRLAIVICSFNRPAAVIDNVGRIAATSARVIIVDQGEDKLVAPAGATVVRQANLGGSGLHPRHSGGARGWCHPCAAAR
jgi:glycosyltransferase involved in cell wall biosynthesis